MKGQWMAALVAAILTGSAAGAAPPKTPDVTVYLTASEPVATYAATSEASAMFHTIGVEVAWRMGKPKPGTVGICIDVHLAADTPKSLLPGALAAAHPYAEIARTITVFYDRVRQRAEESGTPERMLLAHVLVHEITHVLEGIDRHSGSGVMKAHWTYADYAAMARQPLGFDPDDVYWIHRHLEKLAAATSHPEAGAN